MNQPARDAHPPREEPNHSRIAPREALAQFEPPEGMHLAAAGPGREAVRVRYGFRIGTLGLLIPWESGSEVLEMPALTPLPGARAGFLGLINLRGNLVPIYEMRALLGLGAGKSRRHPLALVFDQGDNAVGVVIEGYPVALAALRPLAGETPAPELLREHVRGGYLQDDAVWLEFDHGSFFDQMSRGIALESI